MDNNVQGWLNGQPTLPAALKLHERYWIERAMEGSNLSQAAQKLGISHQALSYILDSRYPELRPEKRRRYRSIMTK